MTEYKRLLRIKQEVDCTDACDCFIDAVHDIIDKHLEELRKSKRGI